MKFYYRCEAGHEMSSPKKMSECIAVAKGRPCKAVLFETTAAGTKKKATEASTTVESGSVKLRTTRRKT